MFFYLMILKVKDISLDLILIKRLLIHNSLIDDSIVFINAFIKYKLVFKYK